MVVLRSVSNAPNQFNITLKFSGSPAPVPPDVDVMKNDNPQVIKKRECVAKLLPP
jgi:hypothetical protein